MQGNAAHRYLPAPADTVAFYWNGSLLCLPARADKRRLNLALDTGAEIGVLQDLTIDSWTCPPVRVLFSWLADYNAGLPGSFVDGLIGYEVLSPYQFAINFPRQEIYFCSGLTPVVGGTPLYGCARRPV